MDETAESSAPDWDAITHDVLCPLCEYNLRGLSEGRCPECGYQFEWSVITDPAARAHPFLFEHHPERNVRSFFRTLLGTITPRRFWKSLSPMQPSRPGRLLAYAVICSMLTLLVVVAPWFWAARQAWLSNSLAPALNVSRQSFSYGGPVPAVQTPTPVVEISWAERWISAKEVWGYERNLRALLVYIVLWLIWPWMTLLSLAVFQISMRRAKIRTIHVARCVFYSFDVGAWLGILIGLGAVVSLVLRPTISVPDEEFTLCVFFVLLLGGFYRMWRAYRFYLKFDHAFLTIFSAAAMTFLLGLSLYLDFERDFIGR